MLSFTELVKLAKEKWYGKLDQHIKPGDMVDYMVQKHNAFVRGPHHDVRFGKGKHTGLYSWATPAYDLKPGWNVQAIQQPVHSWDQLNWEGDIPRGQYGGGNVKLHNAGKALVTSITPDEVHLTKAFDKYQQRLAFIRTHDKNWMMIHPTKKEVDTEKPKYKNIPSYKAEEYLKNLTDDSIATTKIDGALNFLKLLNKPELVSHRISKVTGDNIVHTERFFKGRPELKYPHGWKDSVLMAEVFGEKDGKVIPTQHLSGLLNSSLQKALQVQKDKNINLKALIFDIAQKGKDKIDRSSIPYTKRLEMLNEIVPFLPKDKFIVPEVAQGKKQIQALLNEIRSGKNKYSKEGIVVHSPEGNISKLKLKDEQDVYIKDFVEGTGKYKGKGVGAIKYSLKPDGPVVGTIGSGFSDELRRELYKNKMDYLGRVARVERTEQYPSGALRHPVLISIHHDK